MELASICARLPEGLEGRVDVWALLTALHLEADDRASALRCGLNATRLSNDPGHLSGLPVSMRLAALEGLERETPGQTWVLSALAQLYRETGHAQGAQAIYIRALDADLSNWSWCSDLAELDPQAALQALRGRAEGNPTLLAVMAQLSLGVDDRSSSVHYLQRGFMLEPAREYFVETLVNLGESRLAVGLIEPVVQEQASASLWQTLGGAYSSLGRGSDALVAYLASYRLSPTGSALSAIVAVDPRGLPDAVTVLRQIDCRDDETWGDLADALVAGGGDALAIGCYQRAIALDPTDSEWPPKIAALGEGLPPLALEGESPPDVLPDDELPDDMLLDEGGMTLEEIFSETRAETR